VRRATFYFTKPIGLFFVQSAGILLSANVVGKDKSPLGVERLVRLRLCGTELLGAVAGALAGVVAEPRPNCSLIGAQQCVLSGKCMLLFRVVECVGVERDIESNHIQSGS
jgi:hypothetical protein